MTDAFIWHLLIRWVLFWAAVALVALNLTEARAEFLRTDAADAVFQSPGIQAAPRALRRIHVVRRAATSGHKRAARPARPLPHAVARPVIPPPTPRAEPEAGSCRITGDSIGVMVAMSRGLACASVICGVNRDGPQCSVKGAMNTLWILRHVRSSDIAVISAASNDIKDWHPTLHGRPNPNRQLLANPAKTMAMLEAIRGATGAKIVVWIKPYLREPGAAVAQIAAKYGDLIVGYTRSRDGVHPADPRALARDIGAAIIGATR